MRTPDEIKKGLSCCEKMDKDDAISREYCLDTIAKLPLNWEYGLGVEDCYKIVENAPSVDGQVRKWISVKDRLPEDDVDVIVYAVSNNGGYTMLVTFHTHTLYGFNIDGWASPWQYFTKNYTITHWMPMPEPPKEE